MKLLKFITFSNKSFYQRESELQIASKKKNEQLESLALHKKVSIGHFFSKC